MKGYIVNIEQETLQNENFRRVLYTAQNSQLVVMSIAPGDDIGEEVHTLDQFIRVEQGSAKAVLDGVEHELPADFAIIIPAGTRHNVINTGSEPLKLYTLYAPPEHKDGTVRATKAEALASEEHFDGRTTEA
jgi:mannose-6-phosphate isomerase-like protein (cupin superfamily)